MVCKQVVGEDFGLALANQNIGQSTVWSINNITLEIPEKIKTLVWPCELFVLGVGRFSCVPDLIIIN